MKKIISIFLSLVFIFAVGCNADKSTSNKTGKMMVKDGETEYAILLPETPTDIESYAAGELKNFFFEATGIELDISNETGEETSTGKYLALGDTNVKTQSNVAFATENNSQSFRIKTVDNTVVVAGKSDYGTLWGVYELLYQLFNYEIYAEDTIVIDKDVRNLSLDEFDFFDSPDIEYRNTADGGSYNNIQFSRRLRWTKLSSEIFINPGNWCHNSFDYFGGEGNVDEKFLDTNGKQLCYTAYGDPVRYQEFIQTALTSLIGFVENDKTRNNIMFGIQDSVLEWCNCSGCQASEAKYGTKSASVIIFCNNLHRALEDYFESKGEDRSVNIIFFAYNTITEAPCVKNDKGEWMPTSEDVVADDGVCVMYAPIQANWQISFKDEKNTTFYENLQKWAVLCKEVFIWAYHTNYTDFLAPFDCFNYVQTNYKTFVEEMNIKSIFDQGKHKTIGSGFFTFAEYLNSKLQWNTDSDVKTLTDNFFKAYYGKASTIMQEIYDEFRTVLAFNNSIIGLSTGVYGRDLTEAECWPQATVVKWLNKIDQAFAKIESLKTKDFATYQKLYKHILLESIAIRYVYILNYVDDRAEGTKQMKKQFVEDCQAVGISYASEGMAISDLFK